MATSTTAAQTAVSAVQLASSTKAATDAIAALMVPTAALGLGSASSMVATYRASPAAANTTQVFYMAGRALNVVGITQIHSVAAGGVSTATITKDTATDAPGAGTVLHTGSFDLNATANTVQTAVLAALPATLAMAAGDRLSIKFANSVQSTNGVVVNVSMEPL